MSLTCLIDHSQAKVVFIFVGPSYIAWGNKLDQFLFVDILYACNCTGISYYQGNFVLWWCAGVVIYDPRSIQTDLLNESFNSWNLKERLPQARNVQTFSSQKGETYKAVTLEESLSNGTAQQIGVWSLVVAPRLSNFNMCLDVEASSRKHRARPHYPGKFCARFPGCAPPSLI